MSRKYENLSDDSKQEDIELRTFFLLWLITLYKIDFGKFISKDKSDESPMYNEITTIHPKYMLLIIFIHNIDKYIYLLPYFVLPPVDMSDVQSIHIQDYWRGYSPVAPIKADYHFKLLDEKLIGEARYSVTGNIIQKTTRIIIPVDIVKSFF